MPSSALPSVVLGVPVSVAPSLPQQHAGGDVRSASIASGSGSGGGSAADPLGQLYAFRDRERVRERERGTGSVAAGAPGTVTASVSVADKPNNVAVAMMRPRGSSNDVAATLPGVPLVDTAVVTAGDASAVLINDDRFESRFPVVPTRLPPIAAPQSSGSSGSATSTASRRLAPLSS